MTETKKYEDGAVYIGVVGSESEVGECRDSIDTLQRRPGDIGPHFMRATKGYEARQAHLDTWLGQTQCPWALLLDQDHVFPGNALERLRGHGLPLVSGFYLRRRFAPMVPVWYEPPKSDTVFQVTPWALPLQPGKLYEIGASGWGCMLIHRDVALAVQEVLRGEPVVLEDDMDLWPYDLKRITTALDVLDEISSKEGAPASALRPYVDVLRSEIKPLRGAKDIVGSDIRFSFYARLCGFKMYGDTGVDCRHVVNYPMSLMDYISQPEEVRVNVHRELLADRERENQKLAAILDSMALAKVEPGPNPYRVADVAVAP